MSTHNIPFFNMKKKNTLNYSSSAAMNFSKGLKNEFELAVVNEPSVFEPLKFYCASFELVLLLCVIHASKTRCSAPILFGVSLYKYDLCSFFFVSVFCFRYSG